ncbi:MAG: hypothetical protein JWO53_636, partial [Chlamydiia bacterium]|nr:hypothetical protein [Chlamydiia bacterium]
DFLGDITDDEIYYERAIQALHAAVTADPEFIPARSHLACSYMHLGEVMSDIVAFREACHHFQIVVDQDPEDDLAWSEWGLALMHLVELMHEDGIHTNENLLEQAEGHFLQALFLGNSQASYNLACLYSFQGNVSDALFYFERAVVEEMLPPLEIMKNDGWLKNLRNTDYFKEFLLKAPKDEEEADTI